MILLSPLDKELEIIEHNSDGVRKSSQSCPAVIQPISVSLNGVKKNATLESIEKIASAMNIPLSKLFEKLGGKDSTEKDIPLKCYDFLSAKTKEEQEQLYRILLETDKYKNN